MNGTLSTDRLFWIDTDTASDDAVAILMALRWPGVRVEGISIVAGNVPVEQGSINARHTVELCGADVPVHEGLHRPLVRAPRDARSFHGSDGMGEMNYSPPARPASDPHAVSALLSAFERHRGAITLVTLGPLTNVATALSLEPRLATWVAQCFVMGGAACTVGNVTPAAEYNVWCDPEAARMVFHSGMPILMVGWEMCRGAANVSDDEIASLRALHSPYADFALDCNRSIHTGNRAKYHDPGIPLPDPVTMAVALDPLVCVRRSPCFVEISLDEEITRGMTVVDQLGVLKRQPNVEVCWEIDVRRWKRVLFAALSGQAVTIPS
jgi:purine nucleosidase